MICVAPGLFSTTTGWPQISESRAPIERDSASVAPPGVVGTTIFTGREGKGWAQPGGSAPKAAAKTRLYQTQVYFRLVLLFAIMAAFRTRRFWLRLLDDA